MSTYVLPSAAFGLEFAGETPSSLSVFDRSLRRWCRHLLRWPAGTPNASVLSELRTQEHVRRSLRWCSALLPAYLALGRIGVDLSWYTTHVGSQSFLASDPEATQVPCDVGLLAAWHLHLIALGLTGSWVASRRCTLFVLTFHPRVSH